MTLADFRACAKSALMKRGRAETTVDEVCAAVARWSDYAEQAQGAKFAWSEELARDHGGKAFLPAFLLAFLSAFSGFFVVKRPRDCQRTWAR